MSITNGYLTLEELKTRLELTSEDQDAVLESQIEMASRVIDHLTSRFFYQVEATRYFTPENYLVLDVGDLVSLTELAIDPYGFRDWTQIWQITDYDLEPSGNADISWPYTRIQKSPMGMYSFPKSSRSVRITGTFGWPSVPAAIKEATALEATRAFKRRTAPFGTIGSPGVGGQIRAISQQDPQVREWIAPYIRYGVEAVF